MDYNEVDEASVTPRAIHPMRRVLEIRDFRLYWLGQATSLLGDNFHFIATPWLVLQLTGDPLILGAVMALGGVPRAVFTLVGGAITDRFSPRIVMITSDVIRFVLTAILAVLVITGSIQVWVLYVVALVFGVVSGFFMPASMSMLPLLVAGDDLQPGNALVQGTDQLIGLVGPILAGAVIAYFAATQGAEGGGELTGVAVAFVLDALTFLVSIATLWPIRLRSRPAPAPHEQTESVWASMQSGFKFVWHDALLRMILIVIAGVNFFFVGPILVGIPVLADTRLSDGAIAFGVIMAAYAGGNLGGIILAGGIWQVRRLSLFTVAVIAGFGVGLIVFGVSPSTWLDVLAMLVLGIANGYISIRFITYVQRRTPSQLIGRVMSLILFANVALVPVSQALSGVLSRNNVTTLFVVAGVATLLLATWMVFQPELKLIDSEMAERAPDSAPPG